MKPWQQEISISTEETILKYMPNLRQDVKLLDFGAGYGRYLNMFSKYIDKTNLFAAEIEEDGFQAILQQGYQCYKPEFSTPVIPYDDQCFDYIFTSNVLEHIPNKYYQKYLAEFSRVLKNDGIILFGAPNYPIKRLYDLQKAFQTKQYKYYLLDDPTHCNKLSIYEYEKDFKQFFQEVHFQPSIIFFEKKYEFIRRNRYKFRIFGDKIFGYCKTKHNI